LTYIASTQQTVLSPCCPRLSLHSGTNHKIGCHSHLGYPVAIRTAVSAAYRRPCARLTDGFPVASEFAPGPRHRKHSGLSTVYMQRRRSPVHTRRRSSARTWSTAAAAATACQSSHRLRGIGRRASVNV